MVNPHLSPKEFMRLRRPERFSDSLPIERSLLEKSVLEYHILTVTTRNQEIDFEKFAKAIAEKEICPNLLPHTGPCGGGDSKVDTETFPVAEVIRLGWYYGFSQESSNRWAFAISAKKDWKAKVQSDVKEIVGTGRGYQKIFFISNQQISSKKRAETEDQLSSVFKVAVHILDHTWLVERIINHHHEDIAIALLGIPSSFNKDVYKGRSDIERETQLLDCESQIKSFLTEGNHGFQLVECAIESALLSRSLEHERIIVDGRFERAIRLSEKYGTRHQKLSAVYEWAWASFWWLEDSDKLLDLYPKVEQYVIGSDTAYPLELLLNLFCCLYTAVATKMLDQSIAKLEEKSNLIISQLECQINGSNRGNAAYAKTLKLNLELLLAPQDAPNILSQLYSIVEITDDLADYPFKAITQIISEMGEIFGDTDGYDKLFSLIIQKSAQREGDIKAGRLLLHWGRQLLKREKYYEAIVKFGAALSKLHKDESREDIIRSLFLCGVAYAEVGLLWAARGSIVNAASIATHTTWTRGEITQLQSKCYNALKWIELELGRLPQALEWHRIDLIVQSVRNSGCTVYGDDPDHIHFDHALGRMFLRASLETISEVSNLPAALERLGLFFSSMALKVALGAEELPDPQRDLLVKWQNSPELWKYNRPLITGVHPFILESRILGCTIILSHDNCSPCIEVAESILSAIESFLSTGLKYELFAVEPSLLIEVVKKQDLNTAPISMKYLFNNGSPKILAACGNFNPHTLSREDQTLISQAMFEGLIDIFINIFIGLNSKDILHSLLKEESALDRSICFTKSFVTVGNVLGQNTKCSINDWIEDEDPEITMTRTSIWNEFSSPDMPDGNMKINFANKALLGELETSHSELKHTEIKTTSTIRINLWNHAEWCGVAFAVDLSNTTPPVFALVFRDKQSGMDIFNNWVKEIGEIDVHEDLYVSIIRNISRKSPTSYRVMIGINPDNMKLEGVVKEYILFCRMLNMETSSSENIDRFLVGYNHFNQYRISPAFLNTNNQPEICFELGINKKLIHIKEAYRICNSDYEAIAITEDDDPYIPRDVINAPIFDIIEAKKQNRKK